MLVAYFMLLFLSLNGAKSQQLISSQESPVKIADNFYLEQSQDSFGIRFHGVIETIKLGSKFYPLPQSNVALYKKLRPESLKYRFPALTADNYESLEVIGPYQLEGNRLWFGKQYYDGEGQGGVGAFGYFDLQTRKYVLYSPPEIARWQISALLVEPEAIWLGLNSFVEAASTVPGGLIRWDRNDYRIQRYHLEFVVERLRRDTNRQSTLVLTTSNGYALFRDGQIKRFSTLPSHY